MSAKKIKAKAEKKKAASKAKTQKETKSEIQSEGKAPSGTRGHHQTGASGRYAGEEQMRRTGIDVIGDAPWGTHLCQFYQSKQDLIDILVPYFQQGLVDNEFCMWITSEPLGVDEASSALKSVESALDDYLRKGQIEILDYTQWYTRTGRFNADEVLQGWVEKLEDALDRGYEGLRLTGNTFWLEKKDWQDFTAYEEAINLIIGNYRMLALCTYHLDNCDAHEIMDVVSNHRFALVKRAGRWQMIESSEHQQTEAALRESETLLKRTQEIAHLGSWELDRVNNRLTWSDEAYRIFGLKPRMSPATYETFLERVHPDDRAAVDATYTGSVRENRDTYESEHRVIRKDTGEIRFVHDKCEHVRDATGRIIRSLGMVHDITERRQALELLQREKSKAQNYLDVAGAIILVIDSKKTVSLINKRGSEALGYEEAEIVGKDWFANFLPERIRDQLTDYFERILAGEISPSESHENPILTKTGEERIYSWTTSVLRDSEGSVTGVLSSGVDITERLKAEYALRESEEAAQRQLAQIEAIYRSAHVGLAVFDENMRYVRINDRLAEMNGIPASEHIGRTLREVVPDLADRLEDLHRQVLATGKPILNVELSGITEARPGVMRTWLEHLLPLKDSQGRVYGINVVTHEITERKRAEEALRESETLLKRTQEIAHLGSWDLDLVHNRLTWSEESFRILGLKPQSSPVTYETFLEQVHPDERAVVDAAYTSSVRENRDAYEIEHRVVRKDTGEIRFVHEKCEHVRDVTGRVIGSLGMVQDITELKKTQEALQEAHDLLEDKVVERTLELEAKRWELEKLNKYLEAEIAARKESEAKLREEHERRTYLSKKLNELLEREFDEISRGLHEDIGQILVATRMSLDRMKEKLKEDPEKVAMIDDTLDRLVESSERVRIVSHTYRTDTIDHLGLIPAIRSLTDAARKNSTADVQFFAGDIPDNLAREKKIIMYRIIQEALTNIVRHARAKNISVTLITKDDTLMATIEDDGVGFVQDKTGRADGQRMPLGTVIMEERAAQVGGTLTIDSQAGKGTVVIAEIPIGGVGSQELSVFSNAHDYKA